MVLREALAPALSQVVTHVLGHQVVGDAAVDEERRELLELEPQLSRDFDVHFRESEPLLGPDELGKHQRACLGVVVRRDVTGAAGHLLHHAGIERAGIERVGVVPQDAPAHPRVLVLVGADAGLTRHMLAGEYQRRPTDVGGVKLGRFVAQAGLQRLPQDVLLGYAREGYRVFEDVHPKVGVELLHLLESFQKGGDVQVVVVLQPIAEGPHATLTEDAVAVVVLLQREHVLALEPGIPGHEGGRPGKSSLAGLSNHSYGSQDLVRVAP